VRIPARRRRASLFHSIVDLQASINRFLAETNDDPRPFNSTADPDRIIAAVRRGHQTLDSLLRERLERKVGAAFSMRDTIVESDSLGGGARQL